MWLWPLVDDDIDIVVEWPGLRRRVDRIQVACLARLDSMVR
jgi:hypothetical protein